MRCNLVSLLIVIQTSKIVIGKFISDNIGGRLVYPPGRSSLWRLNFTDVPINENDYKINCGGFKTHWVTNKGKCGVCGDPLRGSRDHEYGGKYFSGKISEHYNQNAIINVSVEILENLKGWFEFKLCPYTKFSDVITQTCLDKYILKIGDTGRTRYRVKQKGVHVLPLKLPDYLTCDRCVLQWRYHTGTRWGCDSDNKCCQGCGLRQEEFYNCADIAIQPNTISPKQAAKETKSSEEKTRSENCELSVYQHWWCRTQCVNEECVSDFCACVHKLNARMRRQTLQCEAIGAWTGNSAMTNWCLNNCNNPQPYCPSDYCYCTDSSQDTTSMSSTLTSTTSTTSTTPTVSTTTTTTTTTTSMTSSSSSPSSAPSSRRTTTAPYPVDAPGVVKVIVTAACGYCQDKNNQTCTNLYCPGYSVTSPEISGSNLYERVDKLSEHFCETCDTDDKLCETLFCSKAAGNPMMRDLGVAIKCAMCHELGDQSCYQDPACSSNVNHVTTTLRTSSTVKSTTGGSNTATNTAPPTLLVCIPKGEYAKVNGMQKWCEDNYPDYGSENICDCTGAMGLNDVQYEDGYVCQGAGVYASDPKMADWCLKNCANNYCPSSHCTCYPPRSTESTFTPTSSTRASKQTDNIALNELNNILCKMSQSDQVTYSSSILRYCPLYDKDFKDPSYNLDRTIKFTVESFNEFSAKNRQEMVFFTDGGLNSGLAYHIQNAFCGVCQGTGGQNCTQYCDR